LTCSCLISPQSWSNNLASDDELLPYVSEFIRLTSESNRAIMFVCLPMLAPLVQCSRRGCLGLNSAATKEGIELSQSQDKTRVQCCERRNDNVSQWKVRGISHVVLTEHSARSRHGPKRKIFRWYWSTCVNILVSICRKANQYGLRSIATCILR
jgi:hypothetical protein